MTKTEKVIKGLECCLAVTKCGTCPYNTGNDLWCGNNNQLLEDAIALLKTQEPVEPTEPDEDNIRYCGACGSPVGYEVLEALGIEYVQYSYCSNCGRAVKWE